MFITKAEEKRKKGEFIVLGFCIEFNKGPLGKKQGGVTLGADEDPPCQLAASPVASEESLRSTAKGRRTSTLIFPSVSTKY